MTRSISLALLLAAVACNEKKESKPAAAPPASPPLATDAGKAAAVPPPPAPAPAAAVEVASLEMEALEPIESIAAFCQAEHCNPKDKGQGVAPAAAPPFRSVKILHSGAGAMEDAGYLFVETGKGWFVGEFLWSLEEDELQHAVHAIEVRDYFAGGAPELVVELDRKLLDSEEGPVMPRQERVLVLCAVNAGGVPSCIDPKEPIVVSSRAEDASWRVELTPGPDGTLGRKAVEGTPPADAVGTVRVVASSE